MNRDSIITYGFMCTGTCGAHWNHSATLRTMLLRNARMTPLAFIEQEAQKAHDAMPECKGCDGMMVLVRAARMVRKGAPK